LRTGATIRHSPDFVHEGLHVLPADGIAASGKIIRRVFFTVLKELRVIKGAVSSSADFICSKKKKPSHKEQTSRIDFFKPMEDFREKKKTGNQCHVVNWTTTKLTNL